MPALRNLPQSAEFTIADGVLTAWNQPADFAGDLQIPEGVSEIADHVFQGQEIQTLTLPSTLVKIGKYAFADNQIKELTLPDSVEVIDDYAFADNRIATLKTNKVKSIGEGRSRTTA